MKRNTAMSMRYRPITLTLASFVEDSTADMLDLFYAVE